MTIQTSELAAELGAYNRVNNQVIRKMVYLDFGIAKYMTPIMGVKGRFPALKSLISGLVQQYATAFSSVGDPSFKAHDLLNYHVKVDELIYPDAVEATWLAKLNQLDERPDQRPISQYIINELLMPKIYENLELVFGQGDVTGNTAPLNAFNGVAKILALGLADATHPMYAIPVAPLTDSNILDQVEAFEKKLPPVFFKKPFPIYMSTLNEYRYRAAYRAEFGSNFLVAADGKMGMSKSFLTGRDIIGLDGLNGSDLFFLTPPDNWLRLCDLNTDPVINDIQVFDRSVKILMDWYDGTAFWFNELVCVSNTIGSGSGLAGNLTSTYYAGTSLP